MAAFVVSGATCGGSDTADSSRQEDNGSVRAFIDPPVTRNDLEGPHWPGFPLLPNGRFPISGWCSPPEWELTDERFQEYRAAGFTVVLPALEDEHVTEVNQRRLEIAARNDLYVVIRDARVYPGRADQGGWRESVAEMVDGYAEHPALLAYLLADEPAPELYPSLSSLTAEFASLDGSHPAMVNMLGLSPLGYGHHGLNYTEFLGSFLEQARPSLFSIDLYTLTNDEDTENFCAGLDTARILSRQLSMPYWAILQLTAHLHLRELDQNEMLWQANLALAHGAKGIVWFTYWTPKPDASNYHSGPIAYDGSRNPSYRLISNVNRLVEPLGRELAYLEAVDVRHTGVLPRGGRPVEKMGPLVSAGGADLTLGFFAGPAGKSAELSAADWEYLLVVNRSYQEEVEARIVSSATLEFTYGEPQELSTATETREGNNYALRFELRPGGAKLLHLRP